MTDFSQWWWQAAGAGPGPGPGPGPDPGDPINQSLRFRGSQLSRPGTGTSNNWALSWWVKRGALASDSIMFHSGLKGVDLKFTASDEIKYQQSVTSGTTSSLYRDPSAWYHILYSYRTTGDVVSLWVNGKAVDPNMTLGGNGWGGDVRIGDASADYYMAAVFFIDGQVVEPTTFGRFNALGVWVPVDPQGLTYGSNGYKLTFEDPSNIGKDYSPNGNDFSDTGFELGNQSSSDYDLMKDSPTQNWATLNPLLTYSNGSGFQVSPASKGNLALNKSPVNQKLGHSTITVTGRVYLEMNQGDTQAGGSGVELFTGSEPRQTGLYYGDPNHYEFFESGSVSQGNGSTGTNLIATYANWAGQGNTASLALDMGTGEAWFAVNGVWQQGDPATGTDPTLTNLNATQDYAFVGMTCGSAADNPTINYGQQPFLYTPPAGFEALQTQNMPTPAILDGREHFQAITDTGANILTAAQTAFPNGLWWIKDRANANQNQLVDSVRTNGYAMSSPSLGPAAPYVAPAGDSVAWCWSAPEAFTSNDGTIASAGQRNVEAGFSIVEYTGNGSAGATVGHGLSRAPEFMLVRDYASNNKLHYCYSEEIGNQSYMYLQSYVGAGANSDIYWNGTSPTDTVFTLGSDANINAPGSQVICYAWHPVPGYSSFGSYQGNGNVDGPVIYTGHSVAWLLVKAADSGENWLVFDSTRSPDNMVDHYLQPNLISEENIGNGNGIDFLSNGFKFRAAGVNQNGNAKKYIYAAFASCPFQSPATAR